ncbi:TPA: Asp-tRNA(Asn)/Glu-tRNA(Gln) amidotransferase subunit GatB [Candidatus Saccharibacteria bacterium]|nr:Asp-tRNA(Asn)/Glu-tRNA(Gln) amidotransferase subunit GatB [Candidatus Saccharibacteria bacterium]HRK41172.1 Asp-tRNA(Asn)/Glu-tRNA(Gln) amidotransferase subunit GatB [Candidatus Saccharibacteria bacterium]
MNLKSITERYQPTIGIECHVQLKTKTKLFSGADNDARDKAPNTTVSPICFGFPGVLPVLNDEALTLAVRAGLALNAELPEISRFERKHYFYPDLPKGYQITQLAEPVIVGGYVDAPQLDGSTRKVRIHHAHLEEDAGKLTHPVSGNESLVDLNRAGTPLIEIVSEADIHSPAEARAYVQELYRLMTFAGVTHGDLYHGNMRFDVNISLAPVGQAELGTRTEIKNLNSFRAVEKAAEFEAIRQAEVLDRGEKVVQETRGWNEDKQKTFSQRSKEDAHDYRYFPDPDIPPVRLDTKRVEAIKRDLPKLPGDYRASWANLGLDSSVINSLLATQPIAAEVAAIQAEAGDVHATKVANWFSSTVRPNDEESLAGMDMNFNRPGLIELANMVEAGDLSSTNAKKVFLAIVDTPSVSARHYASEHNLIQVSDVGAIIAIVETVLADPSSQKAVEDIKAGNEKAIGYLVGQVMKQSHGQANPGLATKLINERIK